MGQNDQAVAAVHDVGQRFAKAELEGDTQALSDMLTSDFTGVGPRGFVLDKHAWLNRHSSGMLVHQKFDWRDVSVRVYGDTAIAVGTEDSAGSFNGRPVNGQCRGTHVLVRMDGTWQIAGVHLSPSPGG